MMKTRTKMIKMEMMIMIAAGILMGSTAVGAAQHTEYDKYQIVTYTDAAGNEIAVRVLADDGETSFNLQFDYYGMDADLDVEKVSGNQYHIVNGEFFQTNGREIVEKAVASGKWIVL